MASQLFTLPSLAQPVPVPSLESGFITPPEATKPYVYWYWISGNISKEGITRDLEAMQRVGIGEAFIGDINQSSNPDRPVTTLTEEWWQLVEHAVREGKRVGVRIGLFNSPGWSQSGGPWVKADQAMRYMTSSETRVRGPLSFNGKLPAPKPKFQDIATLAFPAPRADADTLAARQPRLTASPETPNAAQLLDGKQDAAIAMPEKATITLDAQTDAPFTARSLTLYPQGASRVDCELQIADDAGGFRTVQKVRIDRSNIKSNVGPMPSGPLTVAFAPVTARRFRFILSGTGALTEVELSGQARVERFVEKQLGRMFPSPQPAWNSYIWSPQAEPEAPDLAVLRAGVINLSKQVLHDGTLNWQVPPGEWIIQRVGMSPTGVTNAPAARQAQGLEIDKMSRPHIAAHFEGYVGKLLARMPAADRTALRHIVADSYEVGSQNWTDGLGDDFQKRYGYDPLPFLPTLTGRIVGSADESNRFLWDLRRLIADRIASDYVGGLRELCEKNGLRLWLEPYGHWGFAGEFMQYGAQSDEVAGEFWSGGGGVGALGSVEVRAAASTAHVFGKPVVHAESFTSGGTAFTQDPWTLKLRGDWAATEGVNHPVLHVYISQPSEKKPGIAAWFGVEFNRHNTWFEQSGTWIDYQRRRDFLLQQGKYVADVAYFIGEDAPMMTGVRDPALPPGFSFDYINAGAILERLQVKDGRFVLPDGMSYKVLVLPPLDTMRPELLRVIRDLTAAGGVVLGAPPSRSPSLENYPQADREIAQLAAELWKNCDGVQTKSAAFGKGRVFRNLGLNEVLAAVNTAPDVAISPLADSPMLWIHRRTAEADVYFLSNQSDAELQISADFRVTGRQPELWNAVTSERRDLPQFQNVAGQTRVPLQFAPRQSLFVVFRKPIAATSNAQTFGARNNFPTLGVAAAIGGAWGVSFDPQWGGPANVRFDELTDWTKRPEPGIKHYSGTAIYRKTFDVPAANGNRKLFLDLGSVSSMAKVRLNGRELGTVWCAPWRIEATGAVKAEGNQLEIEVVNTWANRVIGDKALPEEQQLTSVSGGPRIKADSPLVPAGLFGPVNLMSSP